MRWKPNFQQRLPSVPYFFWTHKVIRASRGNTNRKQVDEDFFLNYRKSISRRSKNGTHQLIKARINKDRAGIAAAQHGNNPPAKSLLASSSKPPLSAGRRFRADRPQQAGVLPTCRTWSPRASCFNASSPKKHALIAAKKLRPERSHCPKITPRRYPFRDSEGMGVEFVWCELCEKPALEALRLVGRLHTRQPESLFFAPKMFTMTD